jgi:ParB family chromosome partitioning protein
MRLLGAPERIRQELANGTITEGHARALLGLQHSTDQLAVLDVVIERGLNVRQTEAIVRDWAAKPARRAAAAPVRDPNEEHIENRLRDTLGTKVALKRRSGDGAGSLTIQFHSDEQLQAIYDRIVGEDIW